MDRLEDVIQGVHLERIDGVLIMRGHEHDRWHSIRPHGAHDAESIELRHLDVEEDEVGPQGPDPLHRCDAIATLVDHLHVASVFEQRAQVAACHRFIVDDEGADS
jgi:hypothetical protein